MAKGKEGLLIIYTGDGKGKTTAALGMALRACGRGMRTLMIQFIKEEGASGEHSICPSILKNIDIYTFGMGFVFRGDDPRPHMAMVEDAWVYMEELLENNRYDLLILDELNVVLNLELFPLKSVLKFLKARDPGLHVVITGRGAPKELVKAAQIVTEMREVKHIYKEGVTAILGLDY